MSSISSVTQSGLTLCDPWTAAHQALLSITKSQSWLKLMSIKLVMPSNHLILRCPLLLLPPIFPSIRVFSKESVLQIRWPKYWMSREKLISIPLPTTDLDSSVLKKFTCNAGDPCTIPEWGRSAEEGIGYPFQYSWASLVAQLVKNLPAMQETWV